MQDFLEPADLKAAEESKVRLIGWSDLLKLGESKLEMHFPVPPTEDDLAFIMCACFLACLRTC